MSQCNDGSALQYCVLSLTEDSFSVTLVSMLLTNGRIDINAKDKDGRTALHYAAIYQRVAAAKLLIAVPECDLNITDSIRGYSPLHLAALCAPPTGTESVFQLLMNEQRCNVNLVALASKETALILLGDNEGLVRVLLSCDRYTNFNAKDSGGRTALRRLVSMTKGVYESSTASLLIESRCCDLSEVIGESGNSLLHDAVVTSRAKSVASLVAYLEEDEVMSPMINLQNANKIAAVCMATKFDVLLPFVAFKQCDLTATDSNGLTPLHSAVNRNDLQSVKLLIECGRCNIYAKDRGGNSLLHMAVNYWNPYLPAAADLKTLALIRYLLESGHYNVNAMNSIGQTPLLLLIAGSQPRLHLAKARLLIDHGADLSLSDRKGSCAIEHSVELRVDSRFGLLPSDIRDEKVAYDVVMLLLSEGADTSSDSVKAALAGASKNHRLLVKGLLLAEGVVELRQEPKAKHECCLQ